MSHDYRFYSAAEPPLRIPHIFRGSMYPFTLQAVRPVVARFGQNTPVLQLPSYICMEAYDIVTKHPVPALTL